MKRPARILIVDDDEEDLELTLEAMEDAAGLRAVHTAHDGAEALAYLEEGAAAGSVPGVDIILLDLNMPRMNGIELLRHIRANPSIKHIPVVILTTSSSDRDKQLAKEQCADLFLTKPVDMDHFVEVMEQIEAFWKRCYPS